MDMKKDILSAVAMMAIMPMTAQETYENAKIVDNDLNGTARYVGMGGAMEALGADLSTISTNPAGLGLFRHSTLNASASVMFQSGAPSYANGSKSHASFDQLGFVYSMRTGQNSYLNLAVNYPKSKDFNFILGAANTLNNASQNKQTFQKLRNGIFTSTNDLTYSQLDALYMKTSLYDEKEDVMTYLPATEYQMNREHEGYVADFDFSINGNIHDRVFLGITFGIKDVKYKHNGLYSELLANDGIVDVRDHREITGTGFDMKAGIIVRPFEESPFRIGAYVHTPTWYDLTTRNTTTMTEGGRIHESYDFKIYSPWKFGFSLGHTVGKNLAFGATYEYTDYSTIDTRINDGSRYNWYYDEYYERTRKDVEMNNNTKASLKGVSTIKVGAEYKPLPELALRIGYNYVSPKYKSDAAKDPAAWSPGNYYTSATDFTNWKGTNRITCGIGYQKKNFNVDLAYQFSTQKGNFTPFTEYVESTPNDEGIIDHTQDNVAGFTSVKNNRHQLLLTVGYHF